MPVSVIVIKRNLEKNIGFEEATGKFYHSQTYKTLTQVENGLWAENAEYILDRYNEEAKN